MSTSLEAVATNVTKDRFWVHVDDVAFLPFPFSFLFFFASSKEKEGVHVPAFISQTKTTMANMVRTWSKALDEPWPGLSSKIPAV